MGKYLAVDSGGTKTEWVLLNESGDVIFEYKTHGLASVAPGILPIDEIISEAFFKMKSYEKIDGIYLSLGGPNTDEVYKYLKKAWADTPITVEREASGNAILAAAKFLDCDSVVMCGTGSTAVGIKNNRICFCGGWGPVYGDGGSGGGMGYDALKLFLRYVDGLEEIGNIAALFDALKSGLDLKIFTDRMELKSRALMMTRRELAALAPQIYTLMESGDTTALMLYKKSAKEVAEMADCVSDSGKKVLLCGGFFKDKPVFLDLVRAEFAKRSSAILCYNELLSPITAAEIKVLTDNGIRVTNELFEKLLRREKV